MINKIIPVILAGGSGTRLWPLSRKSYPKQFSQITEELSLFQQTALRVTQEKEMNFSNPITLTNSDFRFIVSEQLQSVNIDPGPIIIEPISKNTAPAILVSSLVALKEDPNAVLLVMPSDHIIKNRKNFHAMINEGMREVSKGNIVLFGIEPSRPETGYGYLRLDEGATEFPKKVTKFLEKPQKEKAVKLIEQGNYLWNSGIFLFRAKDIVKSFQKIVPDLKKNVEKSLDKSKNDLGFLRLDKEHWSRCENISMDYAVIEKSRNLTCLKLDNGWSDLGDWESVWAESRNSKDDVVLSGNSKAFFCQNSLLRSEDKSKLLIGLGLENIVAVSTSDAVLVANKERAQEVKYVVEKLKQENIPQAEVFPKDHRPWGWFESLIVACRFHVKKILVKPGQSLSLQSHRFRSEHWVVVEGTAKVTKGEETMLLTEGQSVYIPLGEKHRLGNPGKASLVIIEVQTGTYLKEDDIVRYEDQYARK